MEGEEDLPPNWSSRLDKRYNRRYYYNKVTKESSWIKPGGTSSASQVGHESRDGIAVRRDSTREEIRCADGSLWLRVYSKTYDRNYYYERGSGKTSWIHPSKQTKSAPGPSPDRGAHDDGDSSDDDSRQSSAKARPEVKEDPEAFQRRIMDQFPALKQAFQDLEEGQRRLQREREEHEAKVKRELEMLNAKQEDFRKAQEGRGDGIKLAMTSNTVAPANDDPSAATSMVRQSVNRPTRKFTLEQDLRRYSIDLERRSVNVADKRQSIKSGIRLDDLRQVMEEANRLAAERGNVPATAETAAAQKQRISGQFGSDSKISEDDGESTTIDEINYEMEGVARGLEYAVREAAAQTEAAQEAQAAGDDKEYYTLLQVSQDATDAELKKAYRRKLIEWHPDKVSAGKRDQAVQLTDLIQNAYKVLSDPWEREIYDWFGFEQYLLHVKVISCFKNYLVAGIELVKHPRKGRPRKRFVWLDRDFTEILTYRRRIMEDQRTGKEKIKGVPIGSITDVTTGRVTDVLKRSGKQSHSGRYFSLICADRTLDFECPTDESCTFIATRMKLLIIDLKRDRDWMHRHYDEVSG
jgi:hypothetical protein